MGVLEHPPKNAHNSWVKKNEILEFEDENLILSKFLQMIMLVYTVYYLNIRFEVI